MTSSTSTANTPADNPPMMQPAIPLDMLRAGERAIINEICGRCEMVARLHEMGLSIGTTLRMMQPGSPCIVAIDDQRISFRGEEAAQILVTPLAAS